MSDSTYDLSKVITGGGGGNVNLTEVGGSAITLGQATEAASLPVVIASNQSPVPVSGTITTSPNVNVHDGSGNTIASTGTSLNVDITNTVPVTLTSTTVTGNVTVIQPTGTNLHTVVDSGTIAVSFPADVAPATQNITAADVATTTTAGANNQSIFTGTPTAGSVASFNVATIQSIDVQVTGTWTGTLQVESSLDGGTTWYKNGGHQKGVTFNSASFTSNFQVATNIAGTTMFRVRAIAAWTGTATVKVVESINADSVYILNALQLLDGGTTGNKATIKSASTGAAATDTAVVVTQSSNLPVTISTVGIVSASSGDNTVIAAQGANKKIYVFAWNISFSGTVNAKFTDGAAGTLLSGLYYGIVNAGGGNAVTPPSYLWVGSANTALVLNLSGATAVGGSVSYFVI